MLPPKPKKKNNKHVIGKGKKKKNWKDKKRELLIALYDHLWNVAHEDCTNREEQGSGLLSNRCAEVREIWHHKGLLQKQMGNSEGTSPEKSLPRLLQKLVYYEAHALLANRAGSKTKTFYLLPAYLATPGNITRNNVFVTVFPSLD